MWRARRTVQAAAGLSTKHVAAGARGRDRARRKRGARISAARSTTPNSAKDAISASRRRSHAFSAISGRTPRRCCGKRAVGRKQDALRTQTEAAAEPRYFRRARASSHPMVNCSGAMTVSKPRSPGRNASARHHPTRLGSAPPAAAARASGRHCGRRSANRRAPNTAPAAAAISISREIGGGGWSINSS